MAGNVATIPGNERYVGAEQITSLSTVKSLSSLDNARSLVVETQAVRLALKIAELNEVSAVSEARIAQLEALLTPKQREQLQARTKE